MGAQADRQSAGLVPLMEEIRARGLTRNRHFTLMSRDDYSRAARLRRYLDGLAREIVLFGEQGELEVRLTRPGPERVTLHLAVERLQLRRVCHLSVAEFDHLCRHHPAAGRLLGRPGPDGGSGCPRRM